MPKPRGLFAYTSAGTCLFFAVLSAIFGDWGWVALWVLLWLFVATYGISSHGWARVASSTSAFTPGPEPFDAPSLLVGTVAALKRQQWDAALRKATGAVVLAAQRIDEPDVGSRDHKARTVAAVLTVRALALGCEEDAIERVHAHAHLADATALLARIEQPTDADVTLRHEAERLRAVFVEHELNEARLLHACRNWPSDLLVAAATR